MFSIKYNFDNHLEPGDILSIQRKKGLLGFEHYAIYIGRNEVIHYSSLSSDVSVQNKIIKTNISHFLKSQRVFYIIDIEKRYHELCKDAAFRKHYMKFFKLFSKREIVERATTRLHEQKYNLLGNNCEHFTTWCALGYNYSGQVMNIFDNPAGTGGKYIYFTKKINQFLGKSLPEEEQFYFDKYYKEHKLSGTFTS